MQKNLQKRWIPKEIPDRELIQKLSSELKVNEVLSTLIAQRGIQSFKEARVYFNPSTDNLHDPFLMKDMQKVVERIESAIKKQEKIMIYGDYDVDGTTSVALLYRYFSKFSKEIQYYVPNRFSEGYGVSREGVDKAIESGVKLMIAIDCGIKDNHEVDFAKQQGIDFIICDHHTPGIKVPDAFAILNPRQTDCFYPFKDLSGCGIGFKLIQAYTKAVQTETDPFELIDLVVVSIASDIVPVVGENRTLAYLGLQKINRNPLPVFKIMLESLELKKELNITDLVFIIGPRLNASGRISHASNTVDLLINNNADEIRKIAIDINAINLQRRELDKEIVEDALKKIEQDEALQKRNTTVLWDAGWHKGVIGIVASRLTDSYYRPTILFTESEGLLVGSARSVVGFDLYEAISQCTDYVDRFGGHKYAAGLSVKKENFDAFSDKFEEVVSSTIKDEQLIPSLVYDVEMPLDFINLKMVNTIDRFGPFGPSNMKPKFVSKQVKLADDPRIVGKDHLKLAIQSEKKLTFDAIAFKQSYLLESLLNGDAFDICYALEINEWNDYKNVQLNIKDLKVSK